MSGAIAAVVVFSSPFSLRVWNICCCRLDLFFGMTHTHTHLNFDLDIQLLEVWPRSLPREQERSVSNK